MPQNGLKMWALDPGLFLGLVTTDWEALGDEGEGLCESEGLSWQKYDGLCFLNHLVFFSLVQVENIKKAIKATSSSQEGNDTDMGVDTREVDVSSLKPVKKSSKMKG